MKEIETILVPPAAKDIAKRHAEYSAKLKDLCRNPDFFKQVREIREKFELPHNGINTDIQQSQYHEEAFCLPYPGYGLKTISGINTNHGIKPPPRDEDKFSKVESLLFSPADIRSLRIKLKRKHKHIFPKFQKHISMLMKNFDLPERFGDALRFYVVYNQFPVMGPHLCRCLIKVFDDKGDKRFFIEVFGDTKEQDLRQAYWYIEALKGRYKIRGEHFYRYKDVYKHRLLKSGQTPVDPTGEPESKNDINNLDYSTKNIYRSRYKKYMKNRHNSK